MVGRYGPPACGLRSPINLYTIFGCKRLTRHRKFYQHYPALCQCNRAKRLYKKGGLDPQPSHCPDEHAQVHILWQFQKRHAKAVNGAPTVGGPCKPITCAFCLQSIWIQHIPSRLPCIVCWRRAKSNACTQIFCVVSHPSKCLAEHVQVHMLWEHESNSCH